MEPESGGQLRYCLSWPWQHLRCFGSWIDEEWQMPEEAEAERAEAETELALAAEIPRS